MIPDQSSSSKRWSNTRDSYHLLHKVAQFCLELGSSWVGPLEVIEAHLYPFIWEEFKTIDSEEMDWALVAGSKLHGLPIFFWAKFKLLVITLKALHGTGSSYFWDCLFPRTSTCPITFKRMGMFLRPSLKGCHLMEFRKCVVSPATSSLWIPFPLSFYRPPLF